MGAEPGSAASGGLPGRDVHALADDGGRRWDRVVTAEVLSDVESLAVHSEKPDRLYAGTAKGVWLSEDGGKHWVLPERGLPHPTAGVALPPWRPDQLFATTLEGIFVGTDDGTGWEPLPSPPAWWGLPIRY